MKSRRSLPRRALVILATALIASGLVVAGIAAYKVVDPQAPARQQALQQQLVTGWQPPGPRAPAHGVQPARRPGQDRPAVRPAADPRAGPELEVRGRGGSLAGPAVDRSGSRHRHPAARPGGQLRRRRARHHRREPVPSRLEATDGGRRGLRHDAAHNLHVPGHRRRRSFHNHLRSRSSPRCRARPANPPPAPTSR